MAHLITGLIFLPILGALFVGALPRLLARAVALGCSFMTALLVFCAARIPPSGVARMPSALFPVPVQMDFHFCPAAITPGISFTVYSR